MLLDATLFATIRHTAAPPRAALLLISLRRCFAEAAAATMPHAIIHAAATHAMLRYDITHDMMPLSTLPMSYAAPCRAMP